MSLPTHEVPRPTHLMSENGAIFVEFPLLAVCCNVDSARYAPINNSFDSCLYSGGKSTKFSS